jgi:polyisoprenoid-binding protein YceI
MKTTFVVATLAGLVLAAPARAVDYSGIAADKSALTFVYKQMGVPIEGNFKKYSAQLSFDPAKPAAAKATLEVDLAGIDAGSAEADDEVAGKAWFNTKAFPQAKFVASGVKALGGNRYQVTGKMTIKGRTQDVSAPFTFTAQTGGALFDGAFVLKRADFAIGEGAWADFGTVANEIQIKFHFLAKAGK